MQETTNSEASLHMEEIYLSILSLKSWAQAGVRRYPEHSRWCPRGYSSTTVMRHSPWHRQEPNALTAAGHPQSLNPTATSPEKQHIHLQHLPRRVLSPAQPRSFPQPACRALLPPATELGSSPARPSSRCSWAAPADSRAWRKGCPSTSPPSQHSRPAMAHPHRLHRPPAAGPAQCPAACASPQRHSSLQGSREPPQPRLVLFDVLYQLFTLKHPLAQQPHHLSLLEISRFSCSFSNIPTAGLQLGHLPAGSMGPTGTQGLQQPFPSKMLLAKPHHPQEQLPSRIYPPWRAPSPASCPSEAEGTWQPQGTEQTSASIRFCQESPVREGEAEQHNPLTPFRCAFSLQGSLTFLINTCGAPPAERQRCLSDVASDTTFPI